MEILRKISNRVNKIFIVLAGVSLLGFTISMLIQVTLRNLFPAHAVSWADSMSRYFFVWGVYFGSVVVTSKGKNITVTILPDALRGSAKKALTFLNCLLFLAVLYFVTRSGFKAMEVTSKRVLDVIPISAAWIYAAVPVFSIFAAFQLIVKTMEDVKKVDGVKSQ